jgi:hypothetical protein
LGKQRARKQEIAQKVADAEPRVIISRSHAQASVNSIAEEIAAAIVAKLIGEEVNKDVVRADLVKRTAE